VKNSAIALTDFIIPHFNGIVLGRYVSVGSGQGPGHEVQPNNRNGITYRLDATNRQGQLGRRLKRFRHPVVSFEVVEMETSVPRLGEKMMQAVLT